MAHSLSLPFRRDRHRAITIELCADDAAADHLAQQLLAIARGLDARAQVSVLEAARDLPWPELSFVAVDVETTGFVAGIDRVIEIAWVRFEHGREVERFATLLDAGVDVPGPVRALTGIAPSMLRGKPAFADVARGLVDVLAAADFAVAYNATFDRGFLAAELRLCGLHLPDVPWVDPLAFVRSLDPSSDGASKKLSEAARRFGVTASTSHRAEGDARMAAELLLKLAPRLSAKTLAELVDAQERWSRLPTPTTTTTSDTIGSRLLSLFR
jgi:DNA polymerase III epsilon subunit family exonuclease